LNFSGVDNDKLIYGRTSGSQKEELNDIHVPNDYCAALALNTNGSVFDSSNLLVGSLRHQKDFMQKFGERVKERSESPCQVCSCELDSKNNPRTVCRRCDMQPVRFQVWGLFCSL